VLQNAKFCNITESLNNDQNVAKQDLAKQLTLLSEIHTV